MVGVSNPPPSAALESSCGVVRGAFPSSVSDGFVLGRVLPAEPAGDLNRDGSEHS